MTAVVAQVASALAGVRSHYATLVTRSPSWRIQQLKQLKKMLSEQESEVVAALKQDLNRPLGECLLAEVAVVVSEIDHAISNLSSWMKPVSVSTPMAHLPASSKIVYEPLGVVLVISPWNYPVQLCLSPLVGIIAAGNCAVIKPSELAPASSSFIAKYVPQYLDKDAFVVLEGGVDVSSALLNQKWDKIMYTGGPNVAKIVMKAAAEHLTPVCLELGGKSPAIIEPDASMTVAAKRLIFGKYLNAGQTCIAPDYLLVHKDARDKLLPLLQKFLVEFYGENPEQSEYTRIISPSHVQRLRGILEDATSRGCTIVHGPSSIPAESDTSKYVAPVFVDVDINNETHMASRLMQEEIFGPIWPIVTYSSISDAIALINANAKPLALYVFSGSSSTQQRVLSETSSGGVVLNDCLMHNANPGLPFGGVGNSGMGAYHGKWGFDEFSHRRAVMNRYTFVDVSAKYPPMDERTVRFLRKLL